MTSVLDDHIILTPTQPVGSGRLQRGWNPGPPHQELFVQRDISTFDCERNNHVVRLILLSGVPLRS